MRKLLIAVPAFVLGSVLTASLTTVARAKDPAPANVYDYKIVNGEPELQAAGKKGYAVIATNMSATGYMIWTLQRK